MVLSLTYDWCLLSKSRLASSITDFLSHTPAHMSLFSHLIFCRTVEYKSVVLLQLNTAGSHPDTSSDFACLFLVPYSPRLTPHILFDIWDTPKLLPTSQSPPHLLKQFSRKLCVFAVPSCWNSSKITQTQEFKTSDGNRVKACLERKWKEKREREENKF